MGTQSGSSNLFGVPNYLSRPVSGRDFNAPRDINVNNDTYTVAFY